MSRANRYPKAVDEDSKSLLRSQCVTANNSIIKMKRRMIPFLLVFSLLSCFLTISSRFANCLSSYYRNKPKLDGSNLPCRQTNDSECLCCDRTGYRTDVCYMKGDLRTHPASSSVVLYSSGKVHTRVEKIKPYTRKWETSIMDTIDELKLVKKDKREETEVIGDFNHSVPAVIFSTGGYTGNVYHEFNDGIIPLYITSIRFNRRVVFLILEYHHWWLTKYEHILSLLSDYSPIDFFSNNSIHCFPEAVIGLQIHDELTVDQALMHDKQTIRDFRQLLDQAYKSRIRHLIEEEKREMGEARERDNVSGRPKLVMLSRNDSRVILNEAQAVALMEEIGFQVRVLRPDKTMELAKLYRVLNGSDVLVGIHGAALTHFLFLRPGSVLLQIIPLGTDWASQKYYAEPAVKMGLKHVGYKVQTKESSLYKEYDEDDPVLRNPSSLTKHGWNVTKSVYLDRQNVELDLERFRRRLEPIYQYCLIGKSRGLF